MSFSTMVRKVKSEVVFAHCKKLVRDTEGASGIEYAIIAAMVAVVIAGFSGSVGDKITGVFDTIKGAL